MSSSSGQIMPSSPSRMVMAHYLLHLSVKIERWDDRLMNVVHTGIVKREVSCSLYLRMKGRRQDLASTKMS